MPNSLPLTATLDGASFKRVKTWLLMFPLEVQDRLVKNALRYYAKDVMYMAAGMTPRRQGFSRLGWSYRVKAWPSGIVWVGIGERIQPGKSSATARGRMRRMQYDSEGVGWRTHFTELGFHSWPKGRPHYGGFGRGWKRGFYHRGQGGKKAGTRASIIAQQALSAKVIPYLLQELYIATRKMHGQQVNRKAAGRIAQVVEGRI